MSRTRISSISHPGGGTRQRWFNGVIQNDAIQPINSGYVKSTCIDDVGFGVDHGLSITHIDKSGIAPLTGDITEGSWRYKYQSWVPDLTFSGTSPISGGTLPTVAVVGTATLARSNPSRPKVSVPNFIFELKDLPGMLRDIGALKLARQAHNLPDTHLGVGGGLGKSISNHYLSYVMGWAPLISDLRKMIEFRDSINNRVNDLDVLFNQNGGLHRSVGKEQLPSKRNGFKGKPGLWSETLTTSGNHIIDSAISKAVSVRYDKVTSTQMWGSVRWTNPFPAHSRISHQELERRARLLVYGISVTPKQLWDAMPWTWLIDWFANFGDVLDSTNNMLSLSPSVPMVMTHSLTEESWTRNDSFSWLSGGGGTLRYETKSRVSQGATLSAAFPMFTEGQFAILGALALQRSR